MVSWLGYGVGIFAPGIHSPDTGVYEVAHNIIRSHTRAYRTYENMFKSIQQGRYCQQCIPNKLPSSLESLQDLNTD